MELGSVVRVRGRRTVVRALYVECTSPSVSVAGLTLRSRWPCCNDRHQDRSSVAARRGQGRRLRRPRWTVGHRRRRLLTTRLVRRRRMPPAPPPPPPPPPPPVRRRRWRTLPTLVVCRCGVVACWSRCACSNPDEGSPAYIRYSLWRPAPRSVPPCHGGGAFTWLPARPQTGVRAWWAVPSAQLGGGRLESSVSFALSSSVSQR